MSSATLRYGVGLAPYEKDTMQRVQYHLDSECLELWSHWEHKTVHKQEQSPQQGALLDETPKAVETAQTIYRVAPGTMSNKVDNGWVETRRKCPQVESEMKDAFLTWYTVSLSRTAALESLRQKDDGNALISTSVCTMKQDRHHLQRVTMIRM